jgi:hypothetical protein
MSQFATNNASDFIMAKGVEESKLGNILKCHLRIARCTAFIMHPVIY